MTKKEQSLELLADDFRKTFGLSTDEPIRLKSILQKAEVLTVYKPLSDKFSGMAIIIKTNESHANKFMLVNSNHPIGKQHFTICHEIYHLFYQKDFNAEVSCSGQFNKKGNPEEYNADLFASYLLLPRLGVLSMIPEDERSKNKIQIETLLFIEQYYACSHSALLFRLLNMDLIDIAYKDNLSHGIKSMARQMGYDLSLYEKGNQGVVIGNYGQLAYKAWEDGIVSESTYLGLMEDIGVEVSKIFEQENGDI